MRYRHSPGNEFLRYTCLLIKPPVDLVIHRPSTIFHLISSEFPCVAFPSLLLVSRGPFLGMDTLFYTGITQSLFKKDVIGPHRPQCGYYYLKKQKKTSSTGAGLEGEMNQYE